MGALFLSRVTARRLGIDPEKVWNLVLLGILTAVIAPRILLIFLNWPDFEVHALWMLGVVSVRSRAAVLGGAGIAIAACLLYARSVRLPFRGTLDALALPLALAATASSVAAFSLPHADAMKAAPRLMVNAALLAAVFGLFSARVRGSRALRGGEVMGTWLFVTGLSDHLLDALWAWNPARSFDLETLVIAALMVVAGGSLWFFSPRNAAAHLP